MSKIRQSFDSSCENAIRFIRVHKLDAERIAYKYLKKEIDLLCAYLGEPPEGLNEIDAAKRLLELI